MIKGGKMKIDRLAQHRKAQERKDSNHFEQWLQANCHHAVSHDEIRNSSKSKVKKIEKILKKQ